MDITKNNVRVFITDILYGCFCMDSVGLRAEAMAAIAACAKGLRV